MTEEKLQRALTLDKRINTLTHLQGRLEMDCAMCAPQMLPLAGLLPNETRQATQLVLDYVSNMLRDAQNEFDGL